MCFNNLDFHLVFQLLHHRRVRRSSDVELVDLFNVASVWHCLGGGKKQKSSPAALDCAVAFHFSVKRSLIKPNKSGGLEITAIGSFNIYLSDPAE